MLFPAMIYIGETDTYYFYMNYSRVTNTFSAFTEVGCCSAYDLLCAPKILHHNFTRYDYRNLLSVFRDINTYDKHSGEAK